MSKQEAAESYPQQLTLNFDITVELKTAPVEIVKNSSVVTFVDFSDARCPAPRN